VRMGRGADGRGLGDVRGGPCAPGRGHGKGLNQCAEAEGGDEGGGRGAGIEFAARRRCLCRPKELSCSREAGKRKGTFRCICVTCWIAWGLPGRAWAPERLATGPQTTDSTFQRHRASIGLWHPPDDQPEYCPTRSNQPTLPP